MNDYYLESDNGDDDIDAPKTPIQSCCIPNFNQNQKRFLLFDFDPNYDTDGYNRKAVIERYCVLLNSPDYMVDRSVGRFSEFAPEENQRGPRPKPSPQKTPLPPNLITVGRKISPNTHKKIVSALAIHSHHLPLAEKIDVRTLFQQTKSFGYRYNYQSQDWECCSKSASY